ncbi:ComEA family DNA-binding protein [Actinomadura viridis]|uniref:ComEA family DNA-binding protein n=1 Tax=Actinomadura viridis TaxID=58110 RepID=UPI0036C7E05F
MSNLGRNIASYAWAFSPCVTLGLGSPLTFAYAGIRLRSWPHWLAVAFYTAVVAAMIGGPVDGWGEVVLLLGLPLTALGGTAHALAIRQRVFFPTASPFELAEKAARDRRELRRWGAELAEREPLTAREMGVGRPDLPRDYDDGGLVDVNHVPAHVLVGALGITDEEARRIVEVREQCGGFVSAEEVAALTGLPPALTPHLAEYGVFLR